MDLIIVQTFFFRVPHADGGIALHFKPGHVHLSFRTVLYARSFAMAPLRHLNFGYAVLDREAMVLAHANTLAASIAFIHVDSRDQFVFAGHFNLRFERGFGGRQPSKGARFSILRKQRTLRDAKGTPLPDL